MTTRIRRSPLASVVLLALLASGATAQGGLVPASLQPQTDANGNSWRFDHTGRLQVSSNYGNVSLQQMNVGGRQFSSSTQLMTPNGRELVLSGQANNVGITRRISFDRDQSAARFVDIFQNTTGAVQSLSVQYHQQLGNQAQSILTDDGSAGGQFGSQARALGAQTRAGQSILFVIADGRKAMRPTINNNSNYQLDLSFQVSVPRSGRVCIVQTIAMRPSLSSKDAIARELKPFLRNKWLAGLGRRQVGAIVNITSRSGLGGELVTPPTVAEELGLEPDDQDQLALGETTLLLGRARCESVAVQTHEGRVTVPFERVAAIVGERQERLPACVYLRDGQRLAGEVELEGLTFALAGGRAIPLEVESLDRLLIAEAAAVEDEGAAVEPDPGEETGGDILLQTHHGDRFLIPGQAEAKMSFSTRWGELEVPVADLLQVVEDELGHVAVLRDGTRFLGFLAGETIRLECALLGPLELRTAEIASISRPSAIQAERDRELDDPVGHAGEPTALSGAAPALVQLGGGSRFIGPIDSEELDLWCGGQRIPLPFSELRSIVNPLEGEPAGPEEPMSLEVELWNGGRVEGEPATPRLGVLTIYGRVDVAATDLVGIQFTRPTASLSERTLIAGLLQRLGSADWREREEATTELAEIGRPAAPQLERALEVEEDPEVLRRLERILEGMED